MTIASGAEETAHPIQPPASGRARKRQRAATAAMRQSRMRSWRSLVLLTELRVAATRKRIAAHGCERWRRRLRKWMITGTKISGKPQRTESWLKGKVMFGRV